MMDVTIERTGSATNSRTCAARASRFLFLSLLMVGVLGGQPAEPSDHDGENRPSILFIMSDDHRDVKQSTSRLGSAGASGGLERNFDLR